MTLEAVCNLAAIAVEVAMYVLLAANWRLLCEV